MSITFQIGAVAAAFYLVLLLLKSYLSLRHLARHPEDAHSEQPITVLQPILGGDPALRETLEANLRNAPACARFVWLIDERDLVGRQATAPLAERHGDQVQVVLCPDCPSGCNPKLFKLNLALPSVETEFFAVLDDDTLLSPGHLQKAMAALAGCELYTGLPRYRMGCNVWSSLVAHFVNNNGILTYLSLLDWVGAISINGMFYVMRTAALREAGGFEPILTQLCDDYALARLVRGHGGRIQQGVTSQLIATSLNGPGQYMRLMHRWFLFATVLVRDQSLMTQALLILMLGLPSLLLWMSLLCLAGGWIGVGVLAALLVLRHLVLIALQRRVFPDPPRLSCWMSPVSELLQTFHLTHASLSHVIVWRSRRIRVGRKGSFVEIPSGRP